MNILQLTKGLSCKILGLITFGTCILSPAPQNLTYTHTLYASCLFLNCNTKAFDFVFKFLYLCFFNWYINIFFIFNFKVPQNIHACMVLWKCLTTSNSRQTKAESPKLQRTSKTNRSATIAQDHGWQNLPYIAKNPQHGSKIAFLLNAIYFLHGSLAKNNVMPVVLCLRYQLVLDGLDSRNRNALVLSSP